VLKTDLLCDVSGYRLKLQNFTFVILDWLGKRFEPDVLSRSVADAITDPDISFPGYRGLMGFTSDKFLVVRVEQVIRVCSDKLLWVVAENPFYGWADLYIKPIQ